MLRWSVVLAAVALGGCMRHGIPADPSIESSFPAAHAASASGESRSPWLLTAGGRPGEAPALRKLPPALASLARPLRLVTYNVHMIRGEHILRALRADRALHDADLIVMEEIHRAPNACSAACVVARELGYYEVYAPGHGTKDGGSDGVAILSRVPITSAQVLPLPFYDVHINSGRRAALAATIDLGGVPVTVYAVHLENRLDVSDRRHQMMPVLEHAARQHTPVIIAGDFNTSPFTWVGHVLPIPTGTQDDNLEELVRAHGFATPVADSGPTSRYLAMKLDGIYTRGFETKSFATAEAGDESDHLALWATLVRSRM